MRNLTTLTFVILSLYACAQAGSLDTDFNGDGIATTFVGSVGGNGRAMAIQPDGKILLAGDATQGIDADYALVRYLPDGSLDPAFGTGGQVLVGGSGDDIARAILLQPDGKIILGGRGGPSNDQFYMVRFTDTGTLDATFGTNGEVTGFMGSGGNEGYAMALQADGKFLLAGSASNGNDLDFALLRYNPDGSQDFDFGIDGGVLTPIGVNAGDVCFTMVVQPDGKILLGGASGSGFNSSGFAMSRFLSNGDLDDTFGTNGVVVSPISTGSNRGFSLALQPDGRILMCGEARGEGPAGFAVARYLPDGTLDASFGTDGIVNTVIGVQSTARSVIVQPDGKILLAGETYPISTDEASDLGLVRYLSDGALDPGFDGDGIVTTPVGNGAIGRAVLLQPDDRIVVAGASTLGFMLARYLNELTVGSMEPDAMDVFAKVYPSPVGDQVTLTYEVKNSTALNCGIYNAEGRLVRTLFSERRPVLGSHRETFDVSDLSAGDYVVVLSQATGSTAISILKL
ncbi:MAG: T9SS type A sorting domain-containing protein [Flavobacteriales bacterium]|nr:T9SS type A sorting domain-containing protein [Flavobacteriales bacterium]